MSFLSDQARKSSWRVVDVKPLMGSHDYCIWITFPVRSWQKGGASTTSLRVRGVPAQCCWKHQKHPRNIRNTLELWKFSDPPGYVPTISLPTLSRNVPWKIIFVFPRTKQVLIPGWNEAFTHYVRYMYINILQTWIYIYIERERDII